jgi:hypothetical protein
VIETNSNDNDCYVCCEKQKPPRPASSSGKLYWSDREGMRVMRANLAGSGRDQRIRSLSLLPYMVNADALGGFDTI